MRAAPPPRTPSRTDLLLEGLAVLYTDGYAASAPLLHHALQAFGTEALALEEAVRSAWVAAVVATDLWDDVQWDLLTGRFLDVVRKAGALSLLLLALRQPFGLRHHERGPRRPRRRGGESLGRGGDRR